MLIGSSIDLIFTKIVLISIYFKKESVMDKKKSEQPEPKKSQKYGSININPQFKK